MSVHTRALRYNVARAYTRTYAYILFIYKKVMKSLLAIYRLTMKTCFFCCLLLVFEGDVHFLHRPQFLAFSLDFNRTPVSFGHELDVFL